MLEQDLNPGLSAEGFTTLGVYVGLSLSDHLPQHMRADGLASGQRAGGSPLPRGQRALGACSTALAGEAATADPAPLPGRSSWGESLHVAGVVE